MNKSSDPILLCQLIEYGQNRQYNHVNKKMDDLTLRSFVFVVFACCTGYDVGKGGGCAHAFDRLS